MKISESKLATGPQQTKKALRGGSKKWTLSHLPAGTSTAFTESLVSLAKIKAGTLRPWSGLSCEQVQELVDGVFGERMHVIRDDDVWCGLVSNIFISFN